MGADRVPRSGEDPHLRDTVVPVAGGRPAGRRLPRRRGSRTDQVGTITTVQGDRLVGATDAPSIGPASDGADPEGTQMNERRKTSRYHSRLHRRARYVEIGKRRVGEA